MAAAVPKHALRIPWDRTSEGYVCQSPGDLPSPGPDVGCGGHPVPPSLALLGAGAGGRSLARNPPLRSSWLSAAGFPWRFEVTRSPHRPPSLQLPSNESVSHLKCIFPNCTEVLEEGKLTVLNSSSVLSSF